MRPKSAHQVGLFGSLLDRDFKPDSASMVKVALTLRLPISTGRVSASSRLQAMGFAVRVSMGESTPEQVCPANSIAVDFAIGIADQTTVAGVVL
eukprot:2352044-Pyramimonas_sp.AAC.1